jgi:transposase
METLLVGIDVGCRRHRVAVGMPDGALLDQFDLEHQPTAFNAFFARVEKQAAKHGLSISVGMEGYGGWARPLDEMVLAKGWTLLNVNNLKLARYKEIFPSPAKTDAIDARKILELMRLRPLLPQAKDILNEVISAPQVNHDMKLLSRRRRQLVNERVMVVNRMHSNLQAIAPGLVEMTGSVDNQWFLRLLTARDTFEQLAHMHHSSLLKIKGIGQKYAGLVRNWQRTAQLSSDVLMVGDMVMEDARRVLALADQITRIEAHLRDLMPESAMATTIASITGFGLICASELAGEIGAIERFSSESALARYIGMAPLDNSSGVYTGAKGGKQVNRRAKAAMMTAVARHYENTPQSKAYYDKKRAEGKKHNQAVRSLGRHITRVIWSLVKNNKLYEIRRMPFEIA